MSTEFDVYAAIDKWDDERHNAHERGSIGRLLYYVQEAFRRNAQ